MQLLIIRHALPLRRENTNGPADPELSDAGHSQARHMADYLASEQLDAIYSSPMRRAQQTAAPLAAAHGLPIITEHGVAEYDRDSDTYIPVEELKAAGDPRYLDMMKGLDGGFTDRPAFNQIVVEAIEAIIERHSGHKVAIVCHGGVINAYLTKVLGLDTDSAGFFYPNYTSIHRVIAARSGERSISTINETSHLRGTGLIMGANPI